MFWESSGFPELYRRSASLRTIMGGPESSRMLDMSAWRPGACAAAAEREVCLTRIGWSGSGRSSAKIRSVTACCMMRYTTSRGSETRVAISS